MTEQPSRDPSAEQDPVDFDDKDVGPVDFDDGGQGPVGLDDFGDQGSVDEPEDGTGTDEA